MNKIKLTVVVLLGMLHQSVGQTVKPDFNMLNSSLKSGSTSIDYATGIMNYHIPLVAKKDGAIEINLGITYAAKGIKVDQTASSVGLGWNFEGGGAVTRTIRGLRDDDPFGGSFYSPAPTDPQQLADFKKLVNKGERDGEADIFNVAYAAGGVNVSFIIKKIAASNTEGFNYIAVPLKRTDVKIVVVKSSYGEIEGFEVTNVRGDRFKFAEMESIGAYFQPGVDNPGYSVSKAPNIWYITEIKDYLGESAQFEYYSDFSSTYNSQIEEKIILYGSPWMEYGNDKNIRAKIDQRMKEMQMNWDARQKLIERAQTLMADIEHQKSVMRLTSPPDFGSAIYEETSDQGNKPNLVPQNFMYDMAASLISRNQNELAGLYGQMPERIHPAESDPSLQYWMQQLYITPNYKNFEKSRTPIISANNVKLLKRIVLKQSSISFVYSNSLRYGFVIGIPEPKTFLTAIKVSDNHGKVLEEVGFSYSPDDICLESVQVKGANANDTEGKYKFDYYGVGTVVDATAKDFWGYYNGYSSGNDGEYCLLPSELMIYTPDPIILHFTASDHFRTIPNTPGISIKPRIPVADKTIFRSLKSVQLPHGGKYEFEYENNTIRRTDENASLLAGGLRIKKITASDGAGASYIKHYKYEFTENGFDQPISTGFNVKKGYQSMTLKVNYASSNMPSDWILSSEPYDFSAQFEDAGNENTFYEYVEETTEGLGRTGYRYLKFAPTATTYPHWLERVLLARVDYNEQGKLVKNERFKYQIDQNELEPYAAGADRFIYNNQFSFSESSNQYRAFPYKAVPYSPSMYQEIRFGSFGRTFENLYQTNMQPRLNVVNPVTSYVIRSGGELLLKEKQSWTAVQDGTNDGVTRPSSVDVYDNSWLFAASYGDGNWTTELLHYDNPAHIYPTRIENIGSAGYKQMVKMKYAADYIPSSAGFMASLQADNRLREVIETQNWVYSPAESAWKLSGAQLNAYNNVSTSAGAPNLFSRTLPSTKYTTELAYPISAGTGNWLEQANSTPPYQTLFHENQSMFKPHSTWSWSGSPWTIMSSGSSSNNKLIKQAIVTSDFDELVVKGAASEEVLRLGHTGSPIRKPINTPMPSNFFNSDYDLVGYLKDLRSRLRKTTLENKFKVQADSLLLTMDRFADYTVFNGFKTKLAHELSLIPSSANPQYDAILAPHTSMQEIRNVSYLISLLNQEAAYQALIGPRYYMVTPSGTFDSKLSLNLYRQSGKRLQFTSNTDFSITYKVLYAGGSQQSYTISNTENKNGIRMAFLDLSTLPNSLNATDLQYTVTNYSPGNVFIIPEGSTFQYSYKDSGGLVKYTVNEHGEAENYFYDERRRLSIVNDKDGNVIRSFKYNQIPN